MYIKSAPHTMKGTVEDLLFHEDPETRLSAATHLGNEAVGVSDQRRALEALTAALQDPCATVQDAVLQSLMRMSVKPHSSG
ncbi:MAG: HEAT repeat domain-containing protein [Nitrospirales bacterium]